MPWASVNSSTYSRWPYGAVVFKIAVTGAEMSFHVFPATCAALWKAGFGVNCMGRLHQS
jgi:hypothetical protein